MFVFEEEFNKTLNKQEKMKLRDVSIKVARKKTLQVVENH